MTDWTDLGRADRFRVEMVSPTDVEDTIGELGGVVLSKCKVAAGYYTDARTSGSVTVVGDGWVRGSMLRIVHEVPEWGYSRELGTYFVSDDDADRNADGEWETTLTLQSRLWALGQGKEATPWAVARNASTLSLTRQLLAREGFPVVDRDAVDRRLSGAVVMEAGKSVLDRLYGLCDLSGNRLDVDGHGRVTVARYVPPASRVPQMAIDLSDPRGIAVAGSVSRSTDWLSMPTECVVSCQWSETKRRGKKSVTVERQVVGRATVSANDHAARAARGYRVTDLHSVSDLQPRTTAQAQKVARSYMAKASVEGVEWSMEVPMVGDLWEGSVIDVTVPGSGSYSGVRRCLVKNVTVNGLSKPTMKLTLREVASGEEE